MVNPAQKKKIYGSHSDYAKKVRSKMAYSEDFVSPYIKGKTVIDWGCGPGHRSPQLIQWGANQIIAWDPLIIGASVHEFIQCGNQITWFEEGHIIIRNKCLNYVQMYLQLMLMVGRARRFFLEGKNHF